LDGKAPRAVQMLPVWVPMSAPACAIAHRANELQSQPSRQPRGGSCDLMYVTLLLVGSR
jgi:hypothetical protein